MVRLSQLPTRRAAPCFCSKVIVISALLLGRASAAPLPVLVTQIPTLGNSGDRFFVFLPMANVGSGAATNIQLKTVALNFMGRPVTTVLQPATLPFKTGSGYLAPTGVRTLDLEFVNRPLTVGKTYMVSISGTYQVDGTTKDFMLTSSVVYGVGFAATYQQVLDVINSKAAALPGSALADNQELLAFVTGLPQISTAGLGNPPSTVWAKFKDNREQIIILNNTALPSQPVEDVRDTAAMPATSADSNGDQAAVLLEEPNAAPDQVPAGPTDLPKSIKARLLNVLGSGFTNPLPQVHSWLVGTQGYSDPIGADATVAALRNVGGDGVFWIQSHGGVDKDKNFPFHVWTTTPTKDPPDPDIKLDLCPDPAHPWPCGDDPNRLVVVGSACDHLSFFTRDCVWETHYGITAEFVNKYWGLFGNNSFVYIDTCDSAAADPSVQNFQHAVFSKHASVYAGWSGEVDTEFATKAAKLVFDRLVGANAFCPEDGLQCHDGPAEPPIFAQRPFDYTQVAFDLKQHSLLTDGKAQLNFIPNPYIATNFGLLAPSISHMTMDEGNVTLNGEGHLTIYGIFGQDPRPNGWVTVGGRAVNGGPVVQGGTHVDIVSWDWGHIVVKLPVSGEGSAGNVQVTVRFHKSNVAQLTEWRSQSGQVTFVLSGAGSQQQQQNYGLHLRADIRQWRKVIHYVPSEPEGPIASAKDSTGALSSSGTGQGIGITFEWKSSKSLVNFFGSPGVKDDFFFLNGTFTDSKHMTFGLDAISTHGGTCTVCTIAGCSTSPLFSQGPFGWFSAWAQHPIWANAEFEPNGDSVSIKSDSESGQVPEIFCSPTNKGSGKLTWQTIASVPDTAPDPKSAR